MQRQANPCPIQAQKVLISVSMGHEVKDFGYGTERKIEREYIGKESTLLEVEIGKASDRVDDRVTVGAPDSHFEELRTRSARGQAFVTIRTEVLLVGASEDRTKAIDSWESHHRRTH